DPEFEAALTKTGIPLTKGFAGAVGTKYDEVKQVFSSGTLTQKCVHLINFGNTFILNNVIAGHQQVLDTIKGNLSADEYVRFLARVKKAKEASFGANKKLYQEREKEAFEAAKGDRGMDAKTAYEPIENLDKKALLWLAGTKGVAGIEDSMSEDQIIAKLKAAGYTITGNLGHGQEMGGSSGGGAASSLAIDALTAKGKPYLEGIRDNIVDPSHAWIFEAVNVLQMPLKAGISGTTHRFMSLAGVLGVGGSDARLAMLGHLQNIEAHSFHEICVAAMGFPNCEYTPGAYVPFSPIPEQQMITAAMETLKKDPEFAAAVTGEKDRKLQAKRLLSPVV
ncbi:MAG: hypothetical protein KC561_12045, partial [Myxococcales bacterium]|nr:hypothetical protein [Myxococcales bacterium]